MSGRGCAITVYVNPGSSATIATVFGERTEVTHVQQHENGLQGWVLPLFVALHTPLQVLRDQLEEQTGFSPHEQVLILCDLSDRDRNNDQLLNEQYDHYSLYDCNIREGSILSLHLVGVSREDATQGGEVRSAGAEVSQQVTHVLSTPITAAQADHSYNGIIFDIESKGPFELDIFSLSVGGMLGRVRIYCRSGSYEQGETENVSGRWWAHHSSISEEGWELIVDTVVKASWDSPSEIFFNKKVTVLPRDRKAFYVHSGLPDDLGIQYQSYHEDDIVAESEHLLVLPGLGHTGSEPFDEINGWYRAHRGLAGNLRYSARLKGWNIWEHALFPRPMREAVRSMLLLNTHASNAVMDHRLANLSPEIIHHYYNREEISIASPSYFHLSTSNYMPQDSFDPRALAYIPPGVLLMSMPLHVLYYVMEFMHWDWFEELYTSQERGYYFPDGREDDDSYDDADDEYDRFHSTRHGAGRQHSHIQSSVGRGRRVQQATQQNHSNGANQSNVHTQQSIARLLTQMFMQQGSAGNGDEDNEYDSEEDFVIDSHTLNVMNSMFGGGINQLLGGLANSSGNSYSDDSNEMNNDEEEEEEEEDVEGEGNEDEETKGDNYLSLSDDYAYTVTETSTVSNESHTTSERTGNINPEPDAVSFDVENGDDYDDDDDDDDDEAYSRLRSRY